MQQRKGWRAGELFVFEGPDGVGKSTLIEMVARRLDEQGASVLVLSFPGKTQGSLGELVYNLHHAPSSLGLRSVNAKSLQIMHIAAHIDCIEENIIPAIDAGKIILLDRYWWSTVVYGLASGISKRLINAMIKLEMSSWGDILPSALFLIKNKIPYRKELPQAKWLSIVDYYDKLSNSEDSKHPIVTIHNSEKIDFVVQDILEKMALYTKSIKHNDLLADKEEKYKNITFHNKWTPTKVTPVYDAYWKFAAERQEIFFKRLSTIMYSYTADNVLSEYKFTNAYRASDRVSQYLIKNVIYKGDKSPEEVFFRIILFKVFNKIQTWELLQEKLGQISYKEYNRETYANILSSAMERNVRIYSSAYIMPTRTREYTSSSKHINYLMILETMMRDNLPSKICEAKSMQHVFELLRSYPMIGDFLAFQYAIDINYSELTDFSEMSFVVPGPGALDGIRKCFSDNGGLSNVDIIKKMADMQEYEFDRLGLKFKTLWGRKLQLIDCQNIFCEIDKYSRVMFPEFSGLSGRTRIKQKFKPNLTPIDYFYPPKWGINEDVQKTLSGRTGGLFDA